MLRKISLLVVLAVVTCSCATSSEEEPASAGQTLLNDTALPSVGVKVTFSSDNVRIKSYDEGIFPIQEPTDRGESFSFAGGQLPAGSSFELRWVPSSASVTNVEWQPDPAVLQQAQEDLAALQAQIDATLLGGTVEVPEGLYVGDLTVTKPVAILAQPGAVLVGDLTVDLEASASDSGNSGSEPGEGSGSEGESAETLTTSISDLAVDGSVKIESADRVLLQGMTISGSSGDGVSVIDSSVGIVNCTITDCAGAAIRATQGSWVGVNGNSFADNAGGESATDTGSAVEESSSSLFSPSASPATQSGTGSESGSGEGAGFGSGSGSGSGSGGAGVGSGSGEGTGPSSGSGSGSGSSTGPAGDGGDGSSSATSSGSGSGSGSGGTGSGAGDGSGSGTGSGSGSGGGSGTGSGSGDGSGSGTGGAADSADPCSMPFASISLDREDVGDLGAPPSELAQVIVDLEVAASVVVTVDLPDGCSKELTQGDLDAGRYVFSLDPVVGECLSSGVKDKPFVFRLHAVSTAMCVADVATEGSIVGVSAAGSTSARDAATPRGSGVRVDLRLGSVTISRSQAIYVVHGYNYGSTPCNPLPLGSCAGSTFTLYVDGQRASARQFSNSYTWGACTSWACGAISQFASDSLSVGDHLFRGEWRSPGYSSDKEITVTVTE